METDTFVQSTLLGLNLATIPLAAVSNHPSRIVWYAPFRIKPQKSNYWQSPPERTVQADDQFISGIFAKYRVLTDLSEVENENG